MQITVQRSGTNVNGSVNAVPVFFGARQRLLRETGLESPPSVIISKWTRYDLGSDRGTLHYKKNVNAKWWDANKCMIPLDRDTYQLELSPFWSLIQWNEYNSLLIWILLFESTSFLSLDPTICGMRVVWNAITKVKMIAHKSFWNISTYLTTVITKYSKNVYIRVLPTGRVHGKISGWISSKNKIHFWSAEWKPD